MDEVQMDNLTREKPLKQWEVVMFNGKDTDSLK
jgi:hypothetical protein